MKTIANFSSRSVILITIQIVAIYVLVGCSKPSDMNPNPSPSPGPSKGTNEVFIQSMAFLPQTLTVSVNSTVKWTNNDGVSHTVTSNTGLFDSGSINNGGTFSFKFTSTGTFDYYCTIHPTMTGKIMVQ